MLLTHYYHEDDKPFRTLSSLPENAALKVIAKLSDRTGAVYRRFRNPQAYLRQRQETEVWLRQEFMRKGGQPVSRFPQYFTVEKAVWIEEGFNGKSCQVQIPLSAFSLRHVSFTYPDSMVSYWLKSQAHEKFYRPEYHGQVFVLDEICNIVDKFGIPVEEWRTDEFRKYDFFIEAQVWIDIPSCLCEEP